MEPKEIELIPSPTLGITNWLEPTKKRAASSVLIPAGNTVVWYEPIKLLSSKIGILEP